jgi:cellobiose phosphorylase
LLGDHVPYAVEAYPEGNQRHLSAESALYCRLVTEGLFGLRPTGFSSFEITPQLPEGWNEMELKNIIAFGGKSIDIQVLRSGKKVNIRVSVSGKLIKSTTLDNGTSLSVKM